MRDLILTGFMGTGKTTVGRILAEQYGLRFVDMDEEIERHAGRSIPEIFASCGEERFRQLETEVLRDLAAGEGRVIATGGGALVSEGNRALLSSDQRIVCLTCRPDELRKRLGRASGRPLLSGRPDQEMSRLLELRRPVYECFEQIDTTGRSPQDTADEIEYRFQVSSASTLTFESTRSSQLVFWRGRLSRIGSLLSSYWVNADVVLVSDQTLVSLGVIQEAVQSMTVRGHRVVTSVLPSGEAGKTLATVENLYAHCQEHRLDRQALVLGIGGGVVCDIAGMLAATYLRGLRLVLAPTTAVAQADAAIGGKVGVDFRGVKNLIGAFHPAELILVDPDALRTLPPEALADGMAEIVKIAMVRSLDLHNWLDDLRRAEDLLDHPAVLRRAACEKVRVVQRDPFERGERALLNFGHTVGHAVEAASEYRISHGQAVSVGMIAESWLGEQKGWSSPGICARLRELLTRFGLPTQAPGIDSDELLPYLLQDKKRAAGSVRFALPTVPGEGSVFTAEEADVRAALDYATGDRA